MGTDRVEVKRQPCPCGGGEIVIERCSPDHAWISAHRVWWESDIDCQKCSQEYALHDDDAEMPRLVRQSDLREREKRRQAWYALHRSIMGSPRVQSVLEQFAARLDQEKSVAAKYRLLAKSGLGGGTEGTFRRRFSGSQAFAKSLSPGQLSQVMDMLGIEDPSISAEVRQLDELWKAVKEPIPTADVQGPVNQAP
jgi:hypothetical protein